MAKIAESIHDQSALCSVRNGATKAKANSTSSTSSLHKPTSARCAGGNNAGHTVVAPIGIEKTQTTFTSERGLIGNGVVVHLPSFFKELDALEEQGLQCSDRIFVSDRVHFVFDFHVIVDDLKEAELGSSSIGPTYSSKASRSGLRVHHLYDHRMFADKFRRIVRACIKRYGHFEYDAEGEIEQYKHLAERLRPIVVDSVSYIHDEPLSRARTP
ncbi:P-loop containing nucleoside triphosphate hydrolase protein [Boletus edulis BED1]|uniref:Adenylosuccinate synthetase n=1 Tax=Boletus edulis BED1 TaxID=1328754 RepID=A0AAD4C280_BOLED|nr:P-loop containing nucleoside triphosphate hydrolase protein [Boletus edulis BED1]